MYMILTMCQVCSKCFIHISAFILLTMLCSRTVALIPILQVSTLRHQQVIAQGHTVRGVEKELGFGQSDLQGLCS